MSANAKMAAERLGMTQSAVHEMIRSGRLVASGRPFLVDDDSIKRVASERRLEALRRISDETELARKTARILDPKPVIITRADGNADPASVAASLNAPSGPDALHLVPAESWSLWGPTVLRSAATRRDWNTSKRGCLTCWTRITADVHQTLGPRGDAACRILLGGGCDTCQAAFAAEADQARTQMLRMRQRLQGQKKMNTADRINRERQAALRAIHETSARFSAANQAWKQLPEVLREGGRGR